MKAYICVACGVQYALSKEPPRNCLICEDERQRTHCGKQQWIQADTLIDGHTNQFQEVEPNLVEIKTTPDFAIGQRAFLIRSKEGNILWDCLSVIDKASIDFIDSLGGLSAIAVSHPHFYGAMIDWSHAFGGVPIYIHEGDRSHVMRPDPVIIFWRRIKQQLKEGIALIHCGGHFDGSSVLHWEQGAENRGALLCGDTIFVTPDTRNVSFMYSYPNHIPLGSKEIKQIFNAIKPLKYDRIYSGWRCCERDAQQVVVDSTARYLRHIGDFSN